MKLNKMKIARLTDEQAKTINGGKEEGGSTKRNFTCTWCTSDDTTFNESCNTKNNAQNTCYHCVSAVEA
jgi:hypothetical protein